MRLSLPHLEHLLKMTFFAKFPLVLLSMGLLISLLHKTCEVYSHQLNIKDHPGLHQFLSDVVYNNLLGQLLKNIPMFSMEL